jgi:hypothetical protein
MAIFDKEEVVAPTQAAAVAAALKPSAKVECTRDTRGDAPCAVADCENCN